MARRVDGARVGFGTFTAAIYVFLILPSVIVLISSVSGAGYLTWPPQGFSLRWLADTFKDPVWRDAFFVSLELVVIVPLLAVALATPAAFALIRGRFRGRGALSLFFVSPLVVPGVMIGLALLSFYVTLNILGSLLGLLIAHTVVVFPYVVRVVMVSVSGYDEAVERAASVLGARRWQVWRDVILPMLRPGITAGMLFAAVVSFGEVAVTPFIAGAATTTLPLELFDYVQYSISPLPAAVSTIMIILVFPVFFMSERLFGLTRSAQ
jgi:putative spermidine/putrescine transport system permease protein